MREGIRQLMQSIGILTRESRGLEKPGERPFSGKTFRYPAGTRARVLLTEQDGVQAVLKDYSESGKSFAFFLSPWLVQREIRALRRLDGIDGVPRVLHRTSSRSFLMEYVSARQLHELEGEIDWERLIGRIERLVERIHASGVIHGDLRNANNILVDENGHPVFVDFVAAVFRGYKLNPFSWLLFRLSLRIDRSAVFKLKTRHAPELITPEDRIRYLTAGPLEKVSRWISVRIRSLVQRISP